MKIVPVVLLVVACSAREAAAPRAVHVAGPTTAVATAGQQAASLVAPGLRLPDGARPLRYDLRLELDPDREGFHGEVRIETRLEVATDHVWLHADDLEISSATFRADGGAGATGAAAGALTLLPVAGDQMRAFGFGRVVGPGIVTLELAFDGHTTRDEEGLFRQRDGDRWYLFSQSESLFARRITPCFDEPRFKVPWRVTLVVPGDDVALANMPEAAARALPDGRREVAFAETPAMPSYLLAFAVGPFALVDAGTVGRSRVPVRVAAPAGDRDHVAVVAAKLPPVVAAIETYLDDPLPWPKLDLVVVPHLFGAMENPGLVTFDAGAIVGDPARHGLAGRFQRIAAHEVAHQWFGNLVTPAWWDDLWLAEAFASWLGDKVAAPLGAFDDPALRRALAREDALEADSEPGASPLHRKVEHDEDPDASFDAIAYDKGEAVLATFEAWIGEAAFRAALRAYLHDHRGGTATAADLVAALAAVSSPAIAVAFESYVEHAGPPVVELALRCDGAPRIAAHARGGLTVPVCVRYPGRGGPARACELVGARTEIRLPQATGCPAWVYGNDGDAYYLSSWTSGGPRGPAPPIGKLSPSERVAVGDDLASAVRRGDVSVPDALGELRTLAVTRDAYARHAAVTVARAIDPIVDDAARPAWSAWLAARFADRLSLDALLHPSDLASRKLRDALLDLVPADNLPAGSVQRAGRMLDQLLGSPGTAPPPELVAVAAASEGRARFERLVARARATNDPELRDELVDALGRFGPDLVPRALQLITRGELPAETVWPAIADYFARGATRATAWRAVRADLAPILARMSPEDAGAVIDATASLCDATSRAEVAAAFGPRLSDILDGRRHLDRALAAIDRCVARRARAGDLSAALSASM